MDSARQILRYSIPGALCLITSVAVVFVSQVAARLSVTAIHPATKLQTTVALIAASVPVGFVLYQMYYATYRPFIPLRRREGRRSYVTRDRGADIFGAVPPERLAQLREVFGARLDVRTWYASPGDRTFLARRLNLLQFDHAAVRSAYPSPPHGPTPTVQQGAHTTLAFPHVEMDPRRPTRIYEENWHENWNVFRSLLDLAATRADAKELKAEFTTLSDIYHALGASRLGVVVGAVLGTFYAWAVYTQQVVDHPIREVVATILSGAVCVVLVWVLHRARQGTWRSAIACAHYGLRWCFEAHPELMQLDGRTYVFLPRMQLRRQ